MSAGIAWRHRGLPKFFTGAGALALIASDCPSCQLCGSGRFVVVDHCHKCGYARGYLCRSCNSLEGHAHQNHPNVDRWEQWRRLCALSGWRYKTPNPKATSYGRCQRLDGEAA